MHRARSTPGTADRTRLRPGWGLPVYEEVVPGRRAPFALRLRVFLTRRKLDRQIGVGNSCDDNAAIRLRARQLTEPRFQQETATCLRRVVDYVDRARYRPNLSAVVIDRRAVRTHREALLGLADRLDRGGAVTPRGIVLAREILSDGAASPLYGRQLGRNLAQSIWAVSDALGGDLDGNDLLGSYA